MTRISALRTLIKINRTLSQGITIILHPLLLPTYIILLLGGFSPLSLSPMNTGKGIQFLVGLIFTATFFLPFLLLVLYSLLRGKKLSMQTLAMPSNQERVFPFILVGFYYTVLTYFIKITPHLNETVFLIVSCSSFAILSIALVSSLWKISAHAVGIGGMLGILIAVQQTAPDAILFYPIIGLFLLAGGLLSARLYLNAHSPSQVSAGFLLGALISLTGYFLYLG